MLCDGLEFCYIIGNGFTGAAFSCMKFITLYNEGPTNLDVNYLSDYVESTGNEMDDFYQVPQIDMTLPYSSDPVNFLDCALTPSFITTS